MITDMYLMLSESVLIFLGMKMVLHFKDFLRDVYESIYRWNDDRFVSKIIWGRRIKSQQKYT